MSYLYIKSPFAPHPHPLCSGKKRGVGGWVGGGRISLERNFALILRHNFTTFHKMLVLLNTIKHQNFYLHTLKYFQYLPIT